MARLRYKEVAVIPIREHRNMVISETYKSDGEYVGISVSEQLVVEEADGTKTKVFLKGRGYGILQEDAMQKIAETLSNIYN